jgi:hypothetical protein
VIKNKL